MTSNKRQRELARRRAERQEARRLERRRQRRRRAVLMSLAGIAGIALIGAAIAYVPDWVGDDNVTANATPTPDLAPVACDADAPRPATVQEYKARPPMTIDTKKPLWATLRTSCGDITWQMFPQYAPQTVNSFVFLAAKSFLDGTFCHRMTEGQTLTVLQCGDPKGTGMGGPGYRLPDENLPKEDPALKLASYPRGTVAMANSGPGTGGSQFFMVIKDSKLASSYTIFAKIVRGIEVLDRIFEVGIQSDAQTLPREGPPKQKVYINDLIISPTLPTQAPLGSVTTNSS